MALDTRVVVRYTEAGEGNSCSHCEQQLRFSARDNKLQKVIANIYRRGAWQEVQHFHRDCYIEAGEPHGPLGSIQPPGRTRSKPLPADPEPNPAAQ